jgi:hypothetical protein
MVDGTPVVANLADLGNFQHSGAPDPQPCAERQGIQMNPSCCEILGKITDPDIEPGKAHLFYTLISQKADLTMPVASMGITDQAKTLL